MTLLTGSVSEGRFTISLPPERPLLLLAVSGTNFATRQRMLGGPRDYGPSGLNAIMLNFGGPASSWDPDAPVYFLPEAGGNGGLLYPDPVPPFDSGTVSTVAGDGSHTQLKEPNGIAVGGDGRVLITEGNEHRRISLITPEGLLKVLAGGPYEAPYGREEYLRDGTGAEARFYGPTGVAIDKDGVAYVADSSNSAIRRVTPDGVVTTLAGRRPWGYADGTGTAALFMQPTGIAIDSHGNVFVADTGNFCIRKITPAGEVTTFAGAKEPGYANGPGAQARFRSPMGLAIDREDNLFVADGANHRIRKITPTGMVSDAYGVPTVLPNGAVRLPRLHQMSAVAVDAAGNLFTAADERVYRIAPGGDVTVAAGYGLYGYADGPSQNAYFASIAGLAVDPHGDVYVTDPGNGRVRKISFGHQ